MFKLLTGGYSKEELRFIRDVLVELKQRTEGNVHVSFDYDKLAESFHSGKTVSDVVDATLSFFDKVESGEIETVPWEEGELETYTLEEFLNGDVPEGKSCGANCECYPQK